MSQTARTPTVASSRNPRSSGRRRSGIDARLTARVTAILCGCALSMPALAQTYYPVEQLLSSGKTVVGEDLRYPTTGAPRITVAIVTVGPGASASFHRHPVPLVAYVLEGELSVDYGAQGVKTYRRGDALIEAMNVSHRGMNHGPDVVKLLAVYIGAEGSDDTVLDQ